MHRQDVLRQRRRDAGLRRLRRVNQAIAGSATGLLVAFAVIAARGFSGHASAATASAADRSQTSAAAPVAHRHHWAPPLLAPGQAPKRAAADRHRAPKRPASPPATATTPAVQQTVPVVVSGGS